jgi:hypothetical protein
VFPAIWPGTPLALTCLPVITLSRLPICVSVRVLFLVLLVIGGARDTRGLSADPAAPAPPAPSGAADRDESEQNIVTMPTTQSMHRFGSHFRITHRFARDLRGGGLGSLASDLFGLDNGAIIGLDYRFAPTANTQVGVYRSMLYRTIQFSGRYDALRQNEAWPVAISGLLSVEGANNFRDDHAPALGAVLSRTYGRRLAFYASPTFVWHSITPAAGTVTGHEGHDHGDEPIEPIAASSSDENTAYVGLGTRVLLPKTTYIALEFTPRVTGFAPGRGTWGVGIEKHTRGHLFQMNFSNSFGTTYGQIARGGEPTNIYLGFNIARKF